MQDFRATELSLAREVKNYFSLSCVLLCSVVWKAYTIKSVLSIHAQRVLNFSLTSSKDTFQKC